MKNVLLLAVAMVFLFLPCHAQETDQEQISIVTYYPSPFGSYKILQLLPTDDIDPDSDMCEREGEMFYSKGNKHLYFCDGSTWQPVGSGSGGETCGWFRGSCPIDWTLDTGVEDNPRQVLPSEYPLNSDELLKVSLCYIVLDRVYSPSACISEADRVFFYCGGAKNEESGVKTPEAACKRCYGETNAGRAFSGAPRCTGDCGCPVVPKWNCYNDSKKVYRKDGGPVCYANYCYRCRYEGDEELPPLDAAYQISYCCPSR